MFRAIGTILLIWYLSTIFTQSFSAADTAISESFRTLEAAAILSQERFETK